MIDRNTLHDAVICKEEDSVLEVSRIMRDTGSRHIIVVDSEQKPVGLISAFDINNRIVAEGKNPGEVRAREMMTKPIDTVELEDSYQSAYEKMTAKGTYTIPIVEKGKLTGILDFNLIFKKLSEARNEKH